MPTDQDQTYETAFEAALKDEFPVEAEKSDFATEATAPADEAKPADPAVTEPAAEVAPAEAVVEPAAEAAPAEAVVEPAVPAPVDRAEFDRLQAEITALRAAAETRKEPVQEQPTHEAIVPPDINSFFSAEEQALLKEYDSDWGDVSKAESLRRKFDLAVMRDEIYREVASALGGVINQVRPLSESVNLSAEEKHYAAIVSAHTDYDAVLKDIPAWVNQQPAYLQAAFGTVLKEGSTTEVIDLFSRFKKETGRTAPQVTQLKTPETHVEPAAKVVDESKIRALTPVAGGRKQDVVNQPDMNDFEGAWARAANSE